MKYRPQRGGLRVRFTDGPILLRAKYIADPSQETYWDWAKEPIRTEHQIKEGVSRFDSDESWQASEALLKR